MPIWGIYLLSTVGVTAGLAMFYSENRNWPERIDELSMLECILMVYCLPELTLYFLAKFKPFKSRNTMR
jgi:hypothetical protein